MVKWTDARRVQKCAVGVRHGDMERRGGLLVSKVSDAKREWPEHNGAAGTRVASHRAISTKLGARRGNEEAQSVAELTLILWERTCRMWT